MVGVSAGGAAGVLTSVIIAGQSAWRGEQPPRLRLDASPSFLTPGWDPLQPKCDFYNASFRYESGLCSHFSIARMSTTVQGEALSRAMDCATAHETDCVLSPEVGLSVPAVFVYSEVSGLQMLIAPKLLPLADDPRPAPMEVQLPSSGRRTGMQLLLNSSVNVEYLEGGTREIKQSLFFDSAAHCVQLLRLAFSDECWSQVD